MILWVAEAASQAIGKENTFIATDDKRIADVAEDGGFRSIMTSADALTGTDRLAEAVIQLDYDIYINVQGDEPLVRPSDILKVASVKEDSMDCVVNAFCWMTDKEDPRNPNVPKIVASEDGHLLYISRSVIPSNKDHDYTSKKFMKQVCIYGFSAEDLRIYREFGRKSNLENQEDIEILRFLELGRKILLVETKAGSLAVDCPGDVLGVEKELQRRSEI